MEIPMPYNAEAEQALLGSVIINPGILVEIDLDPDEFYVQRNKWIWEALQTIVARRSEPDFITLSTEIETSGKLDECGGAAYLAGLVSNTPSSLGAKQYAAIIREAAMRRRAIMISRDLTKAAFDMKSNLTSVVGHVVEQLTMGIRPKTGAIHIKNYLDDLYDEVEERSKDPQKTWGIQTGILDYDKLTGGLQTGEVLYISGEPGVGKSILSMQMGINMSRNGIPGAIYSLEMSGKQVVRRAVSAQARIETRKIKSGSISENEWPILIQAVEELRSYPVYLCEEANLTITALRADLARLKSRYEIKWFVLDYLFLMADGEGRMDDTERTALLARRIKAIAKELDLASITVSSVTKDGMDTAKPTKKSMRGAGEVIHAADVIGNLLPHQTSNGEMPKKNMRTFVFVKGREMEGLGYFNLVKFDHWPSFGDYVPADPNAQRIPVKGASHV